MALLIFGRTVGCLLFSLIASLRGFFQTLKGSLLRNLWWGPPGVLGIWGEGLFIFRELGSTSNYFRGAGEQAHTFGDLGSTAKK